MKPIIRNETPTDIYIKNSDQSFLKSECWLCDVKVREDKGSQHQRIFQNVADALLRGKELIAPLEDGIRGLELGNAMLLSGLKDKSVTLPIDADEYAEMLGKLVATSRYKKKSVSSTKADDFGSSF